jgi:hypothetical protein
MTTAVWTVATDRRAAKLFLPGLDKRFWVGLYLALGWLVLVAIKPMINGMGWVALLLLAIGGVIYSTGTVFYLMKRLKFRRAIWHGHVIGGAGLHYAAVLVGVVLARAVTPDVEFSLEHPAGLQKDRPEGFFRDRAANGQRGKRLSAPLAPDTAIEAAGFPGVRLSVDEADEALQRVADRLAPLRPLLGRTTSTSWPCPAARPAAPSGPAPWWA